MVSWAAPCHWVERDGRSETPNVPCLSGLGADDVVQEARGLLRLLYELSPAPQRLTKVTN